MPTKRPWNRANIFQPFDALPGLKELLRQKELEHEALFDAGGNEKSAGGTREGSRPRMPIRIFPPRP